MVKSETSKPESAPQQPSAPPESASKIHEEVEAHCAELEKFYRRAFNDVPKMSELGDIRVLQATVRDLVRRAMSAGAGAAPAPAAESAELVAERDKLKDALARARADFLNYQSRAGKDLERAEELSLRKYVSDLLPILDSFDLARQDAQPDLQRLREALEMIATSFAQALAVRGLEPIEAKGKPFNPTLHEAVVKRPADQSKGEAPNTVAEELRRGYLWKGLVLRPAQVMVTEAAKA